MGDIAGEVGFAATGGSDVAVALGSGCPIDVGAGVGSTAVLTSSGRGVSVSILGGAGDSTATGGVIPVSEDWGLGGETRGALGLGRVGILFSILGSTGGTIGRSTLTGGRSTGELVIVPEDFGPFLTRSLMASTWSLSRLLS